MSNLHYQDAIAPLEVFIHDTLLCHPNEKFNYSTYGWTLISVVMELGMHKPFLQIIEDEISTPLGLTQLKADLVDSVNYARVTFYEYQDGQHIQSPQVDLSNKWAGGGFICSAEDLAQFGLALVEQGYLTDQTITTLTSSQSTFFGEKTNYGIGFGSGVDKQSNHWFGHSGGSLGGTSMMLIYPELDLVVITLVNLSGAKMADLAWKIAALVQADQSKK
jgi:CubicO group peptidase (beta-lactamase class C family)